MERSETLLMPEVIECKELVRDVIWTRLNELVIATILPNTVGSRCPPKRKIVLLSLRIFEFDPQTGEPKQGCVSG